MPMEVNGLVKAVETSKLDKTVDDADALYKETVGDGLFQVDAQHGTGESVDADRR